MGGHVAANAAHHVGRGEDGGWMWGSGCYWGGVVCGVWWMGGRVDVGKWVLLGCGATAHCGTGAAST
eukprot:5879138-Prorocentrum_lima.AAC.1